jgi:hypothetical protein
VRQARRILLRHVALPSCVFSTCSANLRSQRYGIVTASVALGHNGLVDADVVVIGVGSALITPDLYAAGEQEWSALLTRLVTALAPAGTTAQT